MSPGEVICRSAIHPKYKIADVFDGMSFFNFMRKNSTYPYMSSVTSLEVAGSVDAVHVAGRHTSDLSNKREIEKSEKRPDYTPKRFDYLGYYSLDTAAVHCMTSDYHMAKIVWRPEGGFNAHFHIEIYLINAASESSVEPGDLRSDKDSLVSRVADLRFGPTLCPLAAQNQDLKSLQEETLVPMIRRCVI